MPARTLGVEEEFLLFRRDEDVLADEGSALVDDAQQRFHESVPFERELKRAQIELGTDVSTDLAEISGDLTRRRGELVVAAADHQLRLVASATCPVPYRASTSAGERYQQMAERFAEVERVQLTCAMHVHVGIESDDEGAAALGRIAAWLPVLAALSANSPFYSGVDTGYAAFRQVVWKQWPTAGPTGPFVDGAEYRATVRDLVASGAARDEGMIYFDARLSSKYPTLEIRVCDVCPELSDAITLAALCRALVATETDPKPPRTELLQAAAWRAARWGTTDQLVDPSRGDVGVAAAWDVVGTMVRHVTPALEDTGDLEVVTRGLDAIRARGTGAQRQRVAADGLPARAIDAVALR